jgi:hypothetical protein
MKTKPWLDFLRPFFSRPKPMPRVHQPPPTAAERRLGIRLPDDIDQVNSWPASRRPKWVDDDLRQRYHGVRRRTPPWAPS